MSACTYGCHICGVDMTEAVDSEAYHTLPFASMDDQQMPVCDTCYNAFVFIWEETG